MDTSTLPVLPFLHSCRTPKDVSQIHAILTKTGLIKYRPLATKIIFNFISSHTHLSEFARYIFLKQHAFPIVQPEEETFLWNIVIKSYSHGYCPRGALMILNFIMENGVCVDKFTLSLVLKACSQGGLVREGMQIHGLLCKMEIGSDLYLKNCLIACYMRCGHLQSAKQMFDRMPVHDSVSYNSMIDGFVKHGMVEMAHELFDSVPMEEKNLITWNSMIRGYVQSKDGMSFAWNLFRKMPERDLVSWNTVINGCIKHGKMEDAQALFDKMPNRDLISWTTMIGGYAKLGNVNIARGLFDSLPEKNTICCNTMMAGYIQNSYFMEAIKIFHDMMKAANVSPDDVTLSLALSAIAQLGHTEVGTIVHRYIENNGYSLDGEVGVSLIDMYAKCGAIENALVVFERIEEKNIDHFNAMIGGLAIHGLGEMAFDYFIEIGRLSIIPDDITFIEVLNACGHAGLVKEGMICFELMRRVHNVNPKLQHYGCMVNILGRAGHIEAAINFIEEMPIEPNDVIWRTLLSACKIHKKYNIGDYIAQHLTRSDPCSPSSYVLLSNVYASLDLWDNVKSVRTIMKERNLKKIPGCSWIELDGTVHEFSAQDKSHPQVKEIYTLLDCL